MNPTRTILLTGLGNTGSHLAPLIARAGVGGLLVLVDPDIVEAGNMGAQSYGPDDVGKPKAEAMADRIAGINPLLEIECFVGELEDLPLGYFGDLVVLCLDHDGARQIAAERAWWMGATLIDVAVNGQAGLVRVSRIARGLGNACLECGWSPEQYANLPVRNSCRRILPTRAPAALGSFAASLAASRLFAPAPDDFNTEIVSSPGAVEMWITKLMENGQCRFNHRSPTVECLSHFDLSCGLGQLMDELQTTSIEVPGFSFATRARCSRCESDQEILLLDRNVNLACGRCEWAMETQPFHARTAIRRGEIPPGGENLPLADIGLRPGDIVKTDINRWFQINAVRSHSH